MASLNGVATPPKTMVDFERLFADARRLEHQLNSMFKSPECEKAAETKNGILYCPEAMECRHIVTESRKLTKQMANHLAQSLAWASVLPEQISYVSKGHIEGYGYVYLVAFTPANQ